MTMLKPVLMPSLACAALLAFASQAQAQTAQIGHPAVTERTQAGRQVIEIDMSALTDRAPDPAPRRAPARLAEAPRAAPAPAEPAAAGSQQRKRMPKRVGLYGDATLMSQLGWAQ